METDLGLGVFTHKSSSWGPDPLSSLPPCQDPCAQRLVGLGVAQRTPPAPCLACQHVH